MPIRELLSLGDQSLYQPCKEVVHFDAKLDNIIQDMVDTMRDCHGVGLAANQIGINQQIMTIEVSNNPRYPGQMDIPLMVLINPRVKPVGTAQDTFWEGCLSLPGLRGKVKRYQEIEYQAFDHLGNSFNTNASGFLARIIQHEYDHLKGILIHQRLEDLKDLAFEKYVSDLTASQLEIT